MTPTAPPIAAHAPASAPAQAEALWETDAQGPVLCLRGDWRGRVDLQLPQPPGTPAPAKDESGTEAPWRLDGSGLTFWDSRLAAALWALGRPLDTQRLPEGLRATLSLAGEHANAAPPAAPAPDTLTRVGLRVSTGGERARTSLAFVGQTLQAAVRALGGRSAMRREDLVWQLQQTGPASLPIVSLVSFLVGLIIAYMGAAQLQRFGAQIYIADLVTIGVVREIAALMAGVILAGHVGAAFAAQLGSMQANEEIDALQALGLDPFEHLVLPRVLAMLLMAPLLTAYAALVGLVAGLLVAVGIYRVEPFEYLFRCFDALTLTHVSIGLFKGTVYAVLVALAGCRQGLNAGRSAQAVGEATTAAVVQAIVWIVVAASLMTILFQRLGW